MKIKVCIANFGTGQLGYLERAIREYKTFKKYTTDIRVYTTVPVSEKHTLFPESIGKALPFSCRQDMADSMNDFDVFLYAENDMLITEDNVDAFLEFSETLNENQVAGFIRYENRDQLKILVDANPHWGRIVNKRNENNFSLRNNHQGCFVLLKKDLKKAVESGGFLVPAHTGVYGFLEQGATDPYNNCGLEKVFPYDGSLLQRLLILHMPIKYSVMPRWIKNGITIETLLRY
jgi:hypothetical protein